MKIGILHPYALDESASSTYAAKLATHLAHRGHEVHIISAEREPGRHAMFRTAYAYRNGSGERLVFKKPAGCCYSHGLILPVAPVAYQRSGLAHEKSFTTLTDQEIKEYIVLNCSIVSRICRKHGLDILHANDTLLMPYIASVVKSMEGVPYVVTTHESTTEHRLIWDPRYRPYAVEGLNKADSIIGFDCDVISGIIEICPDLRPKVVEIPDGADTSEFVHIAAERLECLVDRLVHQDTVVSHTEALYSVCLNRTGAAVLG